MAHQGFSSFHFLLILYIFNSLRVAMFQAPTAPPPSHNKPKLNSISYYIESTKGELGVRFTFDPMANTAMHIIISYDTFAPLVKAFFTTQLTETVFDELNRLCPVTMFFLPCSMSKLEKGKLSCALGANQCNLDKIHACVANDLKDHREILAKFVICSISGKTAIQCRDENNIYWKNIDHCIQNGDGDKQCDAFHTQIENEKKKNPSDHPLTLEPTPNAIIDFVSAVCSHLSDANLGCDAVCNSP